MDDNKDNKLQQTLFSIFQLFDLRLCRQSVNWQSSADWTRMMSGIHCDGKLN